MYAMKLFFAMLVSVYISWKLQSCIHMKELYLTTVTSNNYDRACGIYIYIYIYMHIYLYKLYILYETGFYDIPAYVFFFE